MLIAQRALFGVAAAFWLLTGTLALFGVLHLGATGAGARVLGVLMLGNGAAFALAGWLALRGYRLVDLASLVLVAANAVLSVTDEIGLVDVLSLGVNVGLLALPVVNLRRQSVIYWRRE